MTVTWNGQVHPAAEMFPMIDDAEFAGLVKSIEEQGLDNPGWLLPDGTLLDGRNRLKACQAAGIAMRWQVYTGDDPVSFVIRQNIKRRHLNAGQRGFLALQLVPMYEEQARRAQVEAADQGVMGGRPKKTLGADLPQGFSPDTEPAPVQPPAKDKPKVRGKRARDKAAEETGASGRVLGQVKRVAEKAPDLAAKVVAGELAIDAADKEVRIRSAKEQYLAKQAEWDRSANSQGERWEVRLGDFRDVLAELPDGSVDAIVTDPPYPDEFLPLWADLAKHAERVLRPGAPLIAWSGQFRLREVLNHLCGPLRYQWTLCLDMPGANSRFRGPNMMQTWKPIIICANGAWGPHDWFADRVTSPGKEQQLYEWQQNAAPATELIRRYVPEGGLVVDPFTGVGSFGVAALSAGRRFLGAELSEERHMTACERLKGMQ